MLIYCPILLTDFLSLTKLWSISNYNNYVLKHFSNDFWLGANCTYDTQCAPGPVSMGVSITVTYCVECSIYIHKHPISLWMVIMNAINQLALSYHSCGPDPQCIILGMIYRAGLWCIRACIQTGTPACVNTPCSFFQGNVRGLVQYMTHPWIMQCSCINMRAPLWSTCARHHRISGEI